MKLLAPLAWIYSFVMTIRNSLFDCGWLSERTFDIPLISVGNLAVGGTGKTPHTEYILRLLNKAGIPCGMLSRGYGRSTRGFLEVKGQTVQQAGDEPLQVQESCWWSYVCVCEKRCEGVERMLASGKPLNAIVLDDAYQHRHIKPGLSLLLTDYSRLYVDDSVMPAGRLRENPKGARRADVVIVTKCPASLSEEEQNLIKRRLCLTQHQKLFFSKMEYGTLYNPFKEADSLTHGTNEHAPICKFKNLKVLLVCGIARPQPFINYIEEQGAQVETLIYADHHRFSATDIKHIGQKARLADMLLTTQKDATRLLDYDLPLEIKEKLCVQCIEVKFLNQEGEKFNQIILDYVRKNQKHSKVD